MTKTDEFPAYYTYGVDLGCRLSQLLLYVGYVHGSTAGRQSYSDYSGELTAEQLVSITVSPSASPKGSS